MNGSFTPKMSNSLRANRKKCIRLVSRIAKRAGRIAKRTGESIECMPLVRKARALPARKFAMRAA